MSVIQCREYGGAHDLAAMQRLTARLWTPAAAFHVGDLAWGRFQHVRPDADRPTALWWDRDEVVAWAWLEPPGELQFQVDPDYFHLVDALLAWGEEQATGETIETMLMAGTDAAAAAGNQRLAEILRGRGYHPVDEAPFFLHMLQTLAGLQPVEAVGPGLTLRPVAGLHEGAMRAAGHRSAWAGSKVTTDSYRRVMEAWPYRSALDWMVVTDHGEAVATCLGWYDEQNRVGELEPVGTHVSYRRRGLARAVCLACLHALREQGAERAVVYARGDAGYPVPRLLYQQLGFQECARTVPWELRRSVGASARP